MSGARVSSVVARVPGRPGRGRGGRRAGQRQRPRPDRRHRVPAAGRRRARRAGAREPRRPARRPDREAGRRAARTDRRLGGLRPGANVRQPLLVLLHLPAAQGAAPVALRQGRRLPALVPLRQLHDADALHRARPRARDRRAPQPPLRLHPHHRPRAARVDAAQPARRDQPALARRAAARRGRGPRPGRRLPRGQRRRRLGGHARGRAERLLGARVDRPGAARA